MPFTFTITSLSPCIRLHGPKTGSHGGAPWGTLEGGRPCVSTLPSCTGGCGSCFRARRGVGVLDDRTSSFISNGARPHFYTRTYDLHGASICFQHEWPRPPCCVRITEDMQLATSNENVFLLFLYVIKSPSVLYEVDFFTPPLSLKFVQSAK